MSARGTGAKRAPKLPPHQDWAHWRRTNGSSTRAPPRGRPTPNSTAAPGEVRWHSWRETQRFWEKAGGEIRYFHRTDALTGPLVTETTGAMYYHEGNHFQSVRQGVYYEALVRMQVPAVAQQLLRLDHPACILALAQSVIPQKFAGGPKWGGNAAIAPAAAFRHCLAKFRQCDEERRLLLVSAPAFLIHAAPDSYWGGGLKPGRYESDPKIPSDPAYMPGDNWDGLVLMKVREVLGEEASTGRRLPDPIWPKMESPAAQPIVAPSSPPPEVPKIVVPQVAVKVPQVVVSPAAVKGPVVASSEAPRALMEVQLDEVQPPVAGPPNNPFKVPQVPKPKCPTCQKRHTGQCRKAIRAKEGQAAASGPKENQAGLSEFQQNLAGAKRVAQELAGPVRSKSSGAYKRMSKRRKLEANAAAVSVDPMEAAPEPPVQVPVPEVPPPAPEADPALPEEEIAEGPPQNPREEAARARRHRKTMRSRAWRKRRDVRRALDKVEVTKVVEGLVDQVALDNP